MIDLLVLGNAVLVNAYFFHCVWFLQLCSLDLPLVQVLQNIHEGHLLRLQSDDLGDAPSLSSHYRIV